MNRPGAAGAAVRVLPAAEPGPARPSPPGPLPHQTYAALVGGPLDGLPPDITGWRPEELDDGVLPDHRAAHDPGPAPAHRRTGSAPCGPGHR
nr:hypothetical protein [Streptomyces inusitatus]